MKNSISIIFILISYSVNAQVYKYNETVHFKKGTTVYRKDKVPNCDTVKISNGSEIIEKQTYMNDNKEYTITNKEVINSDSEVIRFKDKIIETPLKLSGKGRIYLSDKDDKNIVRINYFLNPKNKINKEAKIKTEIKKIDCFGKNIIVSEKTETLKDKKILNLYKVKNDSDEKNCDWFYYSPKIITVYDKSDTNKIDYYLVDKYSSDIDYYLKLENNYYISLPTTSFDLGPITIPLKIRPGFSKKINNEDIEISSSVEGDLNIGVFGGFSVGRTRFRYQKTEMKELSKINFTIGGFIGISKQDVDSLSSNASKEPLANGIKKNFATISPGIGLLATIYNFQLGLLFGIDTGIGKNAKSWNFNNRPWIGFGIGYSLSSLWKK